MAYEKKTWKNRQSEYPNRRTLTPVSGQQNTYDVIRAEGLIMEEGDAFDQAAMNDLEERISQGIAESGVSVYTHTRSGTVNNFTGTGANGRARMTANVQAGDTFAVNGQAVTAYMGAEDAATAMAGSAYSGKWVSFVAEGGVLNFKGGGGKATVSGLSAGVVKTGTTVTVKQGAKTIQAVTGTFTSDANAAAAQILKGYTAYVKGAKVTGSIASKTAATITPKTVSQTIAAGQYLAGTQTIKGDANLVAANIQIGKSIFGVAGTVYGYCYIATNCGSWLTFQAKIGNGSANANAGRTVPAGTTFGTYTFQSFSSSFVVPFYCRIVFERSSETIGAYKNGAPASSGEYYNAGDIFGFGLPQDDVGSYSAFAFIMP